MHLLCYPLWESVEGSLIMLDALHVHGTAVELHDFLAVLIVDLVSEQNHVEEFFSLHILLRSVRRRFFWDNNALEPVSPNVELRNGDRRRQEWVRLYQTAHKTLWVILVVSLLIRTIPPNFVHDRLQVVVTLHATGEVHRVGSVDACVRLLNIDDGLHFDRLVKYATLTLDCLRFARLCRQSCLTSHKSLELAVKCVEFVTELLVALQGIV